MKPVLPADRATRHATAALGHTTADPSAPRHARALALLAALLLPACDRVITYPEWRVLTDVDTDPPEPCCEPPTRCDPSWWTGADLNGDGLTDLPHRTLVALRPPDAPVPTLPFTVDVDLPAWRAELGLSATIDPASLRLVVQDVDLPATALPTQLVERLHRLHTRQDPLNPDADGVGLLAALWDTDGDLSTPEAPPSSGPTCLAIYFAAEPTPAADPLTTDLRVTEDGALLHLSAAGTLTTLDAEQGGLLSHIGLVDDTPIATQADRCCGNAMHFWSTETSAGPPWGWVPPHFGPATVERLAAGPLFAAVRVTGTRVAEVELDGAPVRYGAYDFDLLYWRFAQRPEIWHLVTHRALEDCTTEHQVDAAYAFRPVQLEHFLVEPTLEPSPLLRRPDTGSDRLTVVHDDNRGVALGLDRAPRHFSELSNPIPRVVLEGYLDTRLAVFGNEWIPPGTPSPATIAGGELIFDHVGVVIRPFRAPWDAIEPELLALIQRFSLTEACTESAAAPRCPSEL